MKCSNCGQELTEEEKIYYDFPPGSKSSLCQACYDRYMTSKSE